MTEEENKAIDYLENLDIDFNTLYRINLRDLDNCKKVILNLIEKLKSRINKRDNEIIQLEESAEKEFLTKIEVKENYISKDKIREKIETLKKEATDRLNEGRENIFVAKMLIIDILEELLKEE